MHVIKQRDLPLIGSSYNFIGADHGNVEISMFFVEAQPGRGAPLHRHAYDEVIVVQEGTSRLVSGDAIREVNSGDIIVIKAGTPHGFVNVGESLLRQIDIHLSPSFRQESLEPTDTSRSAGLPA